MAKLIKLKYKGFALIESLVSFVILSIVLSVTFMCIGWVTNRTMIALEERTTFLMKQIANQTRVELRFYDEKIEKDGFIFEKKIVPIFEIKGLHILEIYSFDHQGKPIGLYEEVLSIQ